VIPGKKYGVDDFVDIARRRLWLLVVPVVLATAAAVVQARLTPNQYRSETVILVVPQQIPESYVRATVTSRIEDRLQSISQQILSRTYLERIILDFDLYVPDRRTSVMENVVETMRRRDISVETVKGDAFKVSFVSGNPVVAMRVTERLAALFIEENRRDREVLANGTNEFLETQLQDARRRLADHEKKVEAYRMQYAGELPSQVEANQQVIQNTQLQIQALLDSLNRDRDRRMLLERTLVDAAAEKDPPAVVTTPGDTQETTLAAQLEAAKLSLQALQARLTEAHPDLVRAKQAVRELETRMAATPHTSSTSPRLSPAEAAKQARLSSLRTEMANLDRQINKKESEELRLRQSIATYQARVEAAPKRESDLIELTRDYTTLQQVYTNLLTKREDSKVAANLERRQAGAQFRILDPARLPERPFSPNRLRIVGLGAAVGLMAGLALVALLEYRDTSMRSDDDVLAAIAIPVLAMIPDIVTTNDQRLNTLRRVLIATACVAFCLSAAVFAWRTLAWRVVVR
jgi:protein tyrosine kinase modulator